MRRFLIWLVCVCALFVVPATAAARPATPELIERAERAGQLDHPRAQLLRAYAIAAPGRLPGAFRSRAPWDGTLVILHLRRDLAQLPAPVRAEIERLLAPPASGEACDSESTGQANVHTTTHFHITYDDVAAGLAIAGYAASLERSWTKEVSAFGWAPPPVLTSNPAPGARYHVRVDDLAAGLYGFVSPVGDHAGSVGNNPATSWNEGDAYASCMVLNRDYSGFPSAPQAALDSTTAHEFNHSIQFGYGALGGANLPDDVFVEGGATWMEDEVHDAADDNVNYLWPSFSDSLGDYDGSPYPYWITFRGFTERYGSGSAGGGEQVMQDFWELTSRNVSGNQDAIGSALAARGTTLADAFHAYAIAVRFNRACAGGYAYPYCFEEGPAYLTSAGAPALQPTVGSAGESATSSVEDNYALAWVGLPAGSAAYDVTLSNTSSGGQLRGSAACDTGAGLALFPLPSIAGPGQSRTLAGFSPAGCQASVLVVTNQSQTASNPSSSASRSFRVSTSPAQAGAHTLAVTRTGSGAGTVTSSPGGIDCGSDCTEAFPAGTSVTLNAVPASGSRFAGWSGACAGSGACSVSMTASRSVVAAFELVADQAPPETALTGGPNGETADITPTFTPNGLAPSISALRLSPSVFRAARAGPAIAALVGTRVSMRLSEAAAVTFRVARLLPGRRVGPRCLRPAPRRAALLRCTRTVRLRGVITRALPEGSSVLRYRGRLRGRALRPGRYRLLVRARDDAGNRSAERRASFVVVR